MDQWIFHNDRILSLDEARLSPGQMGLFMGWGVFTTLRLYQGVPFALDRHWARLTRDAARLAVQLPGDEDGLRQAIADLVRANDRREGMARVLFVRNTGGLWCHAADHPPTDLLIFTRKLVAWPTAHRLILRPMAIFSSGPYAGAKMLSWVLHASALEKARAEGFDEALLLNEKDQLAECTSANIFLVRKGEVLTPPLSSGCLPGVTREILFEITPAAGIQVHEQDLTTADLATADEIFISSTTREVAGVESISPEWTYPAPGKITLALERAFQQYVRSNLDRASSSSW